MTYDMFDFEVKVNTLTSLKGREEKGNQKKRVGEMRYAEGTEEREEVYLVSIIGVHLCGL